MEFSCCTPYSDAVELAKPSPDDKPASAAPDQQPSSTGSATDEPAARKTDVGIADVAHGPELELAPAAQTDAASQDAKPDSHTNEPGDAQPTKVDNPTTKQPAGTVLDRTSLPSHYSQVLHPS